MNSIITALNNDPDLSQIPVHLRPQVLQSLYVATGCDYTSFFTGLGKVSLLTTFFQHATFITSGNDPSGSMGELHVHVSGNAEATNSRYSFLRLIGCAYYKQHTSAFRSHKHMRHFFTVSTVAHLLMTTTTDGFLKLEVQYDKGSILNQSQCHQQRHSYSFGKDVPGY